MTPGVNAAVKAGVSHQTHEYIHQPNAESYAEEAAEKLGVDPACIFKTLVAQADTAELIVAIVPVLRILDLKAAAAALKLKKLKMADKTLVQRSTGYVLGGVSPLGQKKSLRTVIDDSAHNSEVIYVSGGRRGLEISMAPTDLAQLCKAGFAPIAR